MDNSVLSSARASCARLAILVVVFLIGLQDAFAGTPDDGEWLLVDDAFGEVRHEGASVQAGEAFYVLGGRESNAVRIFDPFDGEHGSWSTGAVSPIQLHHFQAVELDGLIYAVGAMTGEFPSEEPVGHVYIYDPLADAWITGPAIPPERARGSGGAVVHEGRIYWISGNTLGHLGPVTALVDVYDPATGTFSPLAEIPHPRDHFFATLYEDRIYVIGGRQTSGDDFFEPTIAEVDVYHIATDTWETLDAQSNLDPGRAAAATDRIGGEIIIAGGESGGQDLAHSETQAFDPNTGLWRNLQPMRTPRHAAQAIVSNDGFYVAAGSPYRGGPAGEVLDTEALFLDGQTSPVGIPITAGNLAGPGLVEFKQETEIITLAHDGGNQAVLITAIDLSGSPAFSLAEPFAGPISVAPGSDTGVAVQFLANDDQLHSATLEVTDSNGQVTSVSLAAQGQGGESVVLFRVNAGGEMLVALDDGPDWSGDTLSEPSEFLVAGGDFTNGFDVQQIEPGVPASTPAALFESERWDPFGGESMLWQFPVASGTPVEIRLYLMNGYPGTADPGERVFDIEIDGVRVFADLDLSAEAGHQVATVRSHHTVSEGTIEIEFFHQIDNPLINGIEVLQTGTQPGTLSATPASIDFGNVEVGASSSRTLSLRNLGGDGDPSISVVSAGSSSLAYSIDLPAGTVIGPGEDHAVEVVFSPDDEGTDAAVLEIEHDGSGSPLSVPLSGTGHADAPPPIAFASQAITTLTSPTQLDFGPDGRLYVSEQHGLIHAFTVSRDEETGSYSVTDSEVIDLIQTIPNHNDDGTPHPATERNVTGMITAGTAENPVLYVSSSDPRIDDPEADTNSGVVSRLTWTGTEWVKRDLVRSLPRSEHDHLPNGLALDATTNTLYLAQGGHTNMGAPSWSFGNLPEYALSAAILSIDLDAIGDTTYDIPTLQGEVFGGRRGDNQAMIVPNGPVQVHSPGYRNVYDVLLTEAGRMYTFDNDSNQGWGGLPVDEGPGGNCTNDINEAGSATYFDNFHHVTGPGYYGGHPNPTRANRNNTFDGLSPVPQGHENPIECEFLIPGAEDGAIALNDASTNGLAEYTASNFGGVMSGNILATSWDGSVLRLSLNQDGDEVIGQESLFTSLAGPLGITTQGDAGQFPGTIWIGQYFTGAITVFEPQDFSECDPDALDPEAVSPNGYTYGDLIDNGLDPCNPAQVPPDFDQDFVSDLNDPDIDGDGILNEDDRFDFDPANGRGTALPHRLSWSGGQLGALGGMSAYNAPGFTGLMAHPDNPISVFEQFDPDRLIPGGAAGIFTVEQATAGDARFNTQENAFHFGIDVGPDAMPFTARTRILGPFAGTEPQDYQSMGLTIGPGDQDNYVKLVTSANGGAGGIELAIEVEGEYSGQTEAAAVIDADYVDLYLVVDPAGPAVQASYVIATDGIRGPRTSLGEAVAFPAEWMADPINGLAVGIISTSREADPFPVSWAFVEAYHGDDEHYPADGRLVVEPSLVDFPDTPVGETSARAVVLTNIGGEPLTLTGQSLISDTAFASDLELPLDLDSGQSQSVELSFMPPAAASFEATLVIEHDGSDSPAEVALSGTGVGVADLGLVMSGGVVHDDGELAEVLYVLVVTNAGPSDVHGAPVGVEFSHLLPDAQWTCSAEDGANCVASGTGKLGGQVDLPTGTAATFEVTASVPLSVLINGLTATAVVEAPEGITDPDPDNNTATLVLMDGVFRDRFEPDSQMPDDN